MKINSKKIISEMKRQGLTYEMLGKRCKPPYSSKQAVEAIVKSGKTFRVIEIIAKALDLPARDLIL